jgi:serine/threonine protein kinase
LLGLSSKPRRYSIDATALRRRSQDVGCSNFVLPCTRLPSRSPSLNTEAAGTAPPDAFGPFRVLHQIGAGTLGPVFRAYDPEREHLVAIKLFKLDLPPERVHQLVAAFERLIAAELTHPVLAAPLATGMTDVTAFLVQDYIGAESLDQVVREYGPAPPADALRAAEQLAGALDAAGAVNILHGALHPRDVLLSTDDTRLTGVGIARALEQVGITSPVRRPYTAPERMAGASWDRRADVFSLAALLHELLWARRVSGFGADAARELPPIEGGDPAAVRAAFARALAEDPEERFTTALEFAEALAHAFPGVTASGTRPVAGTSPSKRGSRMESEPRLPLYISKEMSENMSNETPEIDVDDALRPTAARYEDVDVGRAVFERGVSVEEVPVAGPVGLITGHEPETLSALERTRSAVWPLVLALTVGLAMGFAGGYGVGSHDRTPPSAVATTGTAPAGREFTENAVTEAPKTERPTAPPAKEAPAAVRPSPSPLSGASTSTAAAAAASVAALGRLLIRSVPAGALVSVDGREYGKTPATVRDLARGPHRVRVTRDGYAAQERRVVISPSRPAQSVNVSLERARVPPPARPAPAASAPAATGGAGALVVDSRPAGAKVYLDGKLIGSTPLSLPTVTAGDHAVRLERDGYRHWASSVRVVASERNRVTASLER